MARSTRKWAIVPAAGSGARMMAEIPKQYLKIYDKTILEHTLLALLNSVELDGVVVCLADGDQAFQQLKVSKHKKIKTTVGGKTRALSVLNGLKYLESELAHDDWILVHDAARPCIKLGMVDKMIHQLESDPVGGILAILTTDTLKRASRSGMVAETIDRGDVWHAQTPQMFRHKVLLDSIHGALLEDVQITDESSALEWAGYTPKLIQGDATNLKVTTPEDLTMAEFLLRHKSSKIVES